jgi:quinol monooxygenase YgiN
VSIVRAYRLNAVAGNESGLEQAAFALADAIRPLPGCEGVLVLQDDAAAQRYIFVEIYADAAAHQASAGQVPKALFAGLMAAIDGAPQPVNFAIKYALR